MTEQDDKENNKAQQQPQQNGENGSALSSQLQKIIAKEISEPAAKKSRLDLQSVPTRQYLDQTVVPILLQGLASLSKERPPNAIEYLANYLIKHKDKYDS